MRLFWNMARHFFDSVALATVEKNNDVQISKE
ncbi:MAG: hypothetical protein ACI94Y_003023, partial [Maribacter sp.]